MRILFVLPAPVRVPSGGAAVVYRHARGLVARGHRVTVAAPRRMPGGRGALRSLAKRVGNRLHGVGEASWHQGDAVTTLEVSAPRALDMHAYDSVIATGFQTAPWVHDALRHRERGKVYFVQSDERYQSPSAERTWALPFARVAISSWVAELLDAHGAQVEAVVPNAVDPSQFALTRSIEDRRRTVIALYHRLRVKGPDTLVQTLRALKDRVPDVHAVVVSARPPRHRLPSWVRVVVRPAPAELANLYNQSAVCLHTSRLEGWGLVPMEAAACGCAVVATRSRGVSEYLDAGTSMLLSDVDDAGALARNAAQLLESPERRIELAKAGMRSVARFSWEESTDRLERVLLETA